MAIGNLTAIGKSKEVTPQPTESSHIYMARFRLTYKFYDGETTKYYKCGFRMFTEKEPTPTNLTSFKTWVGINVGNFTNRIIPFQQQGWDDYWIIDYITLSNNKIKFSFYNEFGNLRETADESKLNSNSEIILTRESYYQIF